MMALRDAVLLPPIATPAMTTALGAAPNPRPAAGLPSWLISWPVVMAAACILAGLAGGLLFQDYRVVSAAGQQRAADLAKISAAHLQQTLSAIEVSLQVLDRAPGSFETAGGGAPLGPILARVVRIMPALSNMQVLDAAGRPAVAKTDGAAADPAAQAAHAFHRDRPGDTIRLDWRGPLTADLLISRRISNPDGSFAGIILGHLDPRYFTDFFAALGADRATLRLADGATLADFGAAAAGGEFVATQSLRGLPLVIEIGLGRRAVLAPWQSKRDVGIALVASILLLIMGGVMALRRHTAQALELAALTAQARAETMARCHSEEVSRRKSDFVSQMSHELRTPLNAIIGFSEVIKTASFGPVGQPKYQEYADDIHYSAQHLLSVINNILDMSKVEAGKWQMADDNVALPDLFEALQRLAGERAAREEVQLNLSATPANLVLRGDKRTLVQIMLNLTINAIKFAGPDRRVDLGIEQMPDGSLAINVADRGDGMTAEELARAMRPFDAPMHGAKGKKQDTGLGLPLAAAFAELHGGRVELDSMPGLGTTARLILPAARVQTLH